MVVNKPQSMFVETHLMLGGGGESNQVWSQGLHFEDSTFNHKYDQTVPKERLQGISQHHNMSIGEELEYSFISTGKKERKQPSPAWAKKDSTEQMIFNNIMLKQQSIQSSILEEGSDEIYTGANNTFHSFMKNSPPISPNQSPRGPRNNLYKKSRDHLNNENKVIKNKM